MKKLLLTLALLGGFIAPSFAQPVVSNTLSGNETWNAGQGGGGPGQYITSNLVRNSIATVAGTVGGNITLGGTSTYANLKWGGALLITAQPSAAVITLPANPVPNGAIISVCNVTSAAFSTNAVTLAANTGQTLSVAATLTTLGAGACASEIFNRATTTWYRVQ